MIQTANRLGQIKEYYFSRKLRQIAELNEKGAGILNLGIGNPDQSPHLEVIKELTKQASEKDVHGYQSYKGIPQLRQAFADWYKKGFSVKLNPETEILPLIGSKEGIFHISMTYLNSGDEVLIPNPGYPTYAAASNLAGAINKSYDLASKNSWKPDFEKLEHEDLSKVKIMWVNYPNMPTGANSSEKLFEDLARFGEENDILICNDNPYAFILNDQPLSLLSSGLSDHVLELNSLSKSHNMAGWRMGMIGATKTHIDNILRFKTNLDSGQFLPIQRAAAKALLLDQDWYESINKEYKIRRKFAHEIMHLLECEFDSNQVGMFIWGRVPDKIKSVETWIDEIMMSAKVFITPGFIFGSNGERFVRISLCSTEEILNKAIIQIQNHLPR